MSEPREYLGQVSPPYRVIQISGVPDSLVYAAGDVLFRNADGQAFLLACGTLGTNQLVDLEYIVVREQFVLTATIKANIKLRFSRVGGTSWTVPAMNNPYSAPSNMEDYLGSFDIVTADYEDVNVSGAVGYAIACVQVTEATRMMLQSAVGSKHLHVVPTVGSGAPDYQAATTVTIQFFFRQH